MGRVRLTHTNAISDGRVQSTAVDQRPVWTVVELRTATGTAAAGSEGTATGFSSEEGNRSRMLSLSLDEPGC